MDIKCLSFTVACRWTNAGLPNGNLCLQKLKFWLRPMLQVKVLICSSADYSSTGISLEPEQIRATNGTYSSLRSKEDVLVFNLVADNTREGQVLAKLLNKLDIIRESMGMTVFTMSFKMCWKMSVWKQSLPLYLTEKNQT